MARWRNSSRRTSVPSEVFSLSLGRGPGRGLMSRKLAQIALCAFVLCALMPVHSQSVNERFIAPDEFASSSEIHAWANSPQARGFGFPERLEYSSEWFNVFVTWNCPYSGRSGVYSNAFIRSRDETTWRRVDSSFFERPEPLAYVYVNPASGTLEFIGHSGAVLKSVRVERYKTDGAPSKTR
jgi:hypothetical protein